MRRFFQFRLRELFLLTTLVALACVVAVPAGNFLLACRECHAAKTKHVIVLIDPSYSMGVSDESAP